MMFDCITQQPHNQITAKNMNIVILDGYSVNPGDLSWSQIEQYGNLTVYDRTADSEVAARAADAEVLLTNKVKVTDDVMAMLPKLRYIGVLATGYNVVDTAAAKRRGIIVANVPAYSTDSVVQTTFAHILNITNSVAAYAAAARAGRWSASPDFCYWDAPVRELSQMTLGIVGLGNIGMKVARVALSMGMSVYAFTSKPAQALPAGIRKTTLDGLLGASDIVTLHCPLTPDTHAMINRDTISRMKPGAILINTGRGPLVDEQAVAEALTSGELGAYGADVTVQEPPAADNPLLSAPNAYLTPHIAWATVEARRRLIAAAATNIGAYASGRPVNIVNQ